MQEHQHSVVREGTVVGLLGAVVGALWLLVHDVAIGQPLHTPSALGRVFFAGDVNPGVRDISPEAILGFLFMHVLTFLIGGIVLTAIVHAVSRSPSLRMGLWIGLVVAFGCLLGLTYMLTTSTGERVSFWSVAVGNLLAIVAMGWYLWRRHPRLGTSAPLGAEVKTTPHAPGAPGGAPRR
ncbi:MAG TPA: hypothetical protein VH764_16485 [Gemmatimonadales bacterium]|jgi:hypothetical protein